VPEVARRLGADVVREVRAVPDDDVFTVDPLAVDEPRQIRRVGRPDCGDAVVDLVRVERTNQRSPRPNGQSANALATPSFGPGTMS